MKLRTAGVLFGLLTALPCRAAQVGGLAWPVEQRGLTTSLTVAYTEQTVKDGRDDSASLFRNLLRAEYGVLNDLGVYGTLGMSDIDIDKADYRAGRGGSAGAGLRWGMVRSGDGSLQLVLNLEAEYLTVGDVRRTNYRAVTYVVKQYGASGTSGFFYPFGGFGVSYADYKGKGRVDDYHNKNFIGIFGGADYFVSPNIYFSGEIHLIDEAAGYATVGYRF
ncbi:MAG: hypothetical protein HZB55_22065 [Deltaproteobacteria bacterium]|nr:hypothetical protein [Deltaproteobacteria bacterium]